MNEGGWHVLGAGAIGCLFAHRLSRGGLTVTLLLRQTPRAETVPVTVEENDARREVRLPVSGAGDGGRIENLLVTTKAQDVAGAVNSVAHRLERGSRVVLLANGMGFAEELRECLPGLDFYSGTTTEGAYRTGPRCVRHAGHGTTLVGQPGRDRAPAWFARWASAAAPCRWEADIERALWVKLAVNCAINPLTALHRCNNGALLDQPRLAREVDRLCAEITRVSDAAGFAAAGEGLRETVDRVISATAENRSSMLQDVLAGRPTEIEYITGHLVAVAARHQIPVPCNQALLQGIRALCPDSRRRRPDQR